MADEIVKTDDRLLSMEKVWSGYGTWKSITFANKAYFGEELANIITECLSGRITHDEDHEFDVADFKEDLTDYIWESVYQ